MPYLAADFLQYFWPTRQLQNRPVIARGRAELRPIFVPMRSQSEDGKRSTERPRSARLPNAEVSVMYSTPLRITRNRVACQVADRSIGTGRPGGMARRAAGPYIGIMWMNHAVAAVM